MRGKNAKIENSCNECKWNNYTSCSYEMAITDIANLFRENK